MGYVACRGKKDMYNMSSGRKKLEKKKNALNTQAWVEYAIEMKIVWEGVEWINLAQCR